MQDAEGGKSLAGKPGHKGMIRGKLPELCPVGALFRHLAIRVAIEGEPIPTPGTAAWESFRLWPGQAGVLQLAAPESTMTLEAQHLVV